MKSKILFIVFFTFSLFLTSCEDFLEIEPLDKVSGDQLFSDIRGVKTVLATLYSSLPMEDFNYNPERGGYDWFSIGTTNNGDGGWSISGHTDEVSIYSNSNPTPRTIADGYWDYQSIRYVNQFFETIDMVEMDDETYNRLKSEGHFCRAYLYYGLVKRYGGVPLITEAQQLSDDNSGLYIPRSTEKESWDFILSELDLAIENLPEVTSSVDGTYRATKWSALALKSRVALHAASVAKFWDEAPLTGEAVSTGLVGGMSLADANSYYLTCINTSKEIIDNSGKSLFKPNPSDPVEAAKNYQTIFESPSAAADEILFAKAFIDGSSTGQQGHCTDLFFLPTQCRVGTFYMWSRWSTTLDLVEAFEDYTDDGSGASATLVTRTDGVEDAVLNYADDVDPSLPYQYYNDPYDIFADKDARLHGGIIFPGCTFKGTKIVMQAGMILQDGSKMILTDGSAVGLDGNTYYSYGAPNEAGYSGFARMGQSWASNYSSTGFALRKFLQESASVPPTIHSSTNDWIDLRLAEIYLNYAEAAIESGQGDAGLAAGYLNALRHRAGHTDNIPATIENILKERQVELFFESQRYWDLIRRREYHKLVNNGYKRLALLPILDLRQNPPQYFFARSYIYYDQTAGGFNTDTRGYYLAIPGTASNLLVQNPLY